MRTLFPTALLLVGISGALTGCERCAGTNSEARVRLLVTDEAGEPIEAAHADIDGLPCDEGVAAGTFDCWDIEERGPILLTVWAEGYEPLVERLELQVAGDSLCPYPEIPDLDEVVLVVAQ